MSLFTLSCSGSIFVIYLTSPVRSWDDSTVLLHETSSKASGTVCCRWTQSRYRVLPIRLLEPTPAPFIRKIINEEGRWGVSSQRRVPTESRPGHVRQSLSLVCTRLCVLSDERQSRTHPVYKVLTLFSIGQHTLVVGSPDILPMFAKGASGWVSGARLCMMLNVRIVLTRMLLN